MRKRFYTMLFISCIIISIARGQQHYYKKYPHEYGHFDLTKHLIDIMLYIRNIQKLDKKLINSSNAICFTLIYNQIFFFIANAEYNQNNRKYNLSMRKLEWQSSPIYSYSQESPRNLNFIENNANQNLHKKCQSINHHCRYVKTSPYHKFYENNQNVNSYQQCNTGYNKGLKHPQLKQQIFKSSINNYLPFEIQKLQWKHIKEEESFVINNEMGRQNFLEKQNSKLKGKIIILENQLNYIKQILQKRVCQNQLIMRLEKKDQETQQIKNQIINLKKELASKQVIINNNVQTIKSLKIKILLLNKESNLHYQRYKEIIELNNRSIRDVKQQNCIQPKRTQQKKSNLSYQISQKNQNQIPHYTLSKIRLTQNGKENKQSRLQRSVTINQVKSTYQPISKYFKTPNKMQAVDNNFIEEPIKSNCIPLSIIGKDQLKDFLSTNSCSNLHIKGKNLRTTIENCNIEQKINYLRNQNKNLKKVLLFL